MCVRAIYSFSLTEYYLPKPEARTGCHQRFLEQWVLTTTIIFFFFFSAFCKFLAESFALSLTEKKLKNTRTQGGLIVSQEIDVQMCFIRFFSRLENIKHLQGAFAKLDLIWLPVP